jgi:hypothetical protein
VTPPVLPGTVWRVEPSGPRGGGLAAWAAPGSVRVDEVVDGWARAGWAGLARRSGPWAVAVPWASAPPEARGPGAPGAVVVAHDPTGIQPLWWARAADGGVLVGSHLPSLADHPDVDDALDPESVAIRWNWSAGGWEALRRTDLRDVRAVPFGHGLVVSPDGGVHEHRFWDPAQLAAPTGDVRPEAWVERLRTTLDASFAQAAIDLAGRPAAYVGAVPGDPAPGRITAHGSRATGRSQPFVATYPIGTAGLAGERHALAVERASSIDHHRYLTRNIVRHAVDVPDAVARGAQVLVVSEGIGSLSREADRAEADLLAAGHPWRAWRMASVDRAPAHARERYLSAVDVAGPAWLRRALTASRRGLPRRFRPGPAVRGAGRTAIDGDELARRFPMSAQLARERSAAMRSAASARQFRLALLMGGEPWRRLESLHSLAARLGISTVLAPYLDVDVVELTLTAPWQASTWRGGRHDAWDAVRRGWGIEPPALGAPVPKGELAGGPRRSLLEVDPEILDVMWLVGPGRTVRLGRPVDHVDPASWVAARHGDDR